ncbi:MAG TPA: tetratricopeptide repeat protein [Deltaproteobacteria bacterium]|nr:tetratricopeptide repeat protein [Deltaproteobacteria bacterium]
MGKKGNVVLVIMLVIVIAFLFFLSVPLGGKIGLLREATISFIFRKPPRFISMEVNVDGQDKTIKSGETLQISGNETIIITKVNANTFFDSYLTADVVGFGKANDLHEPIYASEIRKQLISAGIRSMPIDIFYIERNIAKIPLEIELTREDFSRRINEAENSDDKIVILKNAHAAFPKDRDFLDSLDDLLSKKGDYETLAGIYRGVVDADPEDMNAHARLSNYYIKLGLMKEAMAMNQKIIDAERATAVTYRRMAYIAGQLGDFEKRVGYLNKALELDKGNDSIILDLAKTYEQAGKTKEALSIYKAAATSARDKEILIPVIEDALKNNQYKDARTVLERYVSYYPEDKNAYAQLGMISGKLGDTNAQITYYKKAVDLSPKDALLLYNLGTAYEKAGKSKEALSTFKQVLKIKQGDKDSLRKAAYLSQNLGNYKDAYSLYQALVAVDDKLEYKKGLVSASVGLKDHDKIIDACNAYLKSKKEHDVAITLAYAYEARAATRQGKERLNDLEAALDAYRLALKINPQSTKAKEKIPELRIETIKLKRGV